jgi:hypothetical protein
LKKDFISLAIILTAVVLIGIIIAVGFHISARTGIGQDSKPPETAQTSSGPPATDRPAGSTAPAGSSAPDAGTSTPGTGQTEATLPDTGLATLPPETPPETAPLTYPAVSGSIVKQVDDSGYFKVCLDWETLERTSDSALLKLTVVLRVTSIGVGARTAVITVNGEEHSISCSAAEASYSKGVRHEIPIGTLEVRVPLEAGSGDVSLGLVYNYKGSFSKVTYSSIALEGTAQIK